jgi:CHAD domain-containing protein
MGRRDDPGVSRVVRRAGHLPRLWQHEAFGAGLQRVLRRCVELAARVAGEDAHRARLALKRARAVLRVAEAMRIAWARPERRRLAAHARKLAAARDWAVVTELARKCAPDLPRAAQRRAAALVALQCMVAGVRLAAWSRWLIAERERLGVSRPRRARARLLPKAELELGAPGFRCVWPRLSRRELRRAIAKSVRVVRRRGRLDLDRASEDELHEWRKAVIVLREQLYVLRPLLLPEAGGVAGRLRRLARKLGAAADWMMLIDAARGPTRRVPAATGLGRLIAHARRKRHRALVEAEVAWRALRPALRRGLISRHPADPAGRRPVARARAASG